MPFFWGFSILALFIQTSYSLSDSRAPLSVDFLDGVFIIIPALELSKHAVLAQRLQALCLPYDPKNQFSLSNEKIRSEVIRLHVLCSLCSG